MRRLRRFCPVLPRLSSCREWGRRPGDAFSCRGGGVLNSFPAPRIVTVTGTIPHDIRIVKSQPTKPEPPSVSRDFLLTSADSPPILTPSAPSPSNTHQAVAPVADNKLYYGDNFKILGRYAEEGLML